ncbi:MAG: SMC family ATPase [Smithella sp.]|jgi:exonuclease SbcC
MKINNLRLKGYIGIKRGLGLDEINIDFRNYAGLVGFAGQNGLGKSTVLENLHPFNTLASRSGALFNHTYLRDSEKELSFTYDGHNYKTLIKIDCQSGKSEGFVWKDGESMVNGKISAYAKYVTDLFGSQNLFFNSVFCAQNASKLSDMTTGQLKTLFAEFLRLDRLQANEETCKQKINVLSGKAEQIDTSIEALRKRTGGAQDIKTEIARLTLLKEEKEALKTDLNAKLVEAQKERERLKDVITRNEVFEKQVGEMTATLLDMEKNRDQEDIDNGKKLAGLRVEYLKLAGEIAAADAVLTKEAEILAAVEKGREVTARIEKLTIKIDTVNCDISSLQESAHKIEIRVQELKQSLQYRENDKAVIDIDMSILEVRQAIRDKEKAVDDLKADRETHDLNNKIKSYNDQLSAMAGRDTECTSTTCQFILAAKHAEEDLHNTQIMLENRKSLIDQSVNDVVDAIEGLQKKITLLTDNRNTRVLELEAEVNATDQEITKEESLLKAKKTLLAEAQDVLSIYRQELAKARMGLTQYQTLAAKQSEIAVAKSKKEDRTKALEENKKQGLAISGEWNERAAFLDAQIDQRKEKINEITACIDEDADGKLTGAEIAIENINKSISLADYSITEAGKEIAAKENELSGMAEAETQLQKANEDKLRVQADIADWTYIRNACGKNGLQALEIDGAAPLITGYANDLLSKAFGSLYTVKFRTQDDEGKECLDIIVITEDGTEVLLDNLSGGQKVWSLMALRLAMTLLSKEKSGRNFQTAFFDEMDGALDSDNAVNFIELYKSFMNIGHFETIPFISHKQECRSMADHVLMFEVGKQPYWN